VSIGPTVAELVDDLLAGPTPEERDEGITTALRATDVAGVQVNEGRATVELTGMLDGGARTDQVLAFAQIVCTLTASPAIASVSFTHDRRAVGVPRADGSLSHAPATAADYAALLTR
jgi:spore germination protein GerM